VGEIEDLERGGLWGFIIQKIQNLYWMRILEGLYEFFKLSLCYNILKIKNILIESINLSFSKKILFQEM